ncbi:hypothetical protein NQZ68_007494 [Dissostichus eleginoides]|nr:hypothetical protein NQZ68_007494 [Dissostichus eleginoides]
MESYKEEQRDEPYNILLVQRYTMQHENRAAASVWKGWGGGLDLPGWIKAQRWTPSTQSGCDKDISVTVLLSASGGYGTVKCIWRKRGHHLVQITFNLQTPALSIYSTPTTKPDPGNL